MALPATPDPQMRHEPDTSANAEIRHVTLPSGRMIEVVYLDEPAAAAPAQVSPAPGGVVRRDELVREAASDLTLCGRCGCEFVQPVDWDEAGPRHWRLELRCPNCGGRGTVVVEDEVVDHYDLELERGSAALARALHRVSQENIDDEVARFAAALGADAILPEDF